MNLLNWQVGLATVASSLAVGGLTRRSNDPPLAKTRSYQESLGGLSGTALNFIEGPRSSSPFLLRTPRPRVSRHAPERYSRQQWP